MYDFILHSGLLNFLAGVLVVAILTMAVFRLDEIVAAPKRPKTPRRPVNGCDKSGHLLLSDPDGRLWRASPRAG